MANENMVLKVALFGGAAYVAYQWLVAPTTTAKGHI